MQLFNACFNFAEAGFIQWCWPDGNSYLEQDNVLVEMFSLMKSESETQISKKINKSK